MYVQHFFIFLYLPCVSNSYAILVLPRSHASQGLVYQGKLIGTADLVGSQKLSKSDLEEGFHKHQIPDVAAVSYAQPWAWELCHPRKYDPPIRFLPKPGRVWISISLPDKAKTIEVCLSKAQKPDNSLEELQEIGRLAGLADFPKYKSPYLRLVSKELDLSEQFRYQQDDRGSKAEALIAALERRLKVATLEDEVACFQTSEVRQLLALKGLEKQGTPSQARARIMKHAWSTGVALDAPCQAPAGAAATTAGLGQQEKPTKESSSKAKKKKLKASAQPDATGIVVAPSTETNSGQNVSQPAQLVVATSTAETSSGQIVPEHEAEGGSSREGVAERMGCRLFDSRSLRCFLIFFDFRN